MGSASVRRLGAGFGFKANLDGKRAAVVDVGSIKLSNSFFAFAKEFKNLLCVKFAISGWVVVSAFAVFVQIEKRVGKSPQLLWRTVFRIL
jgi:hypothetical protein